MNHIANFEIFISFVLLEWRKSYAFGCQMWKLRGRQTAFEGRHGGGPTMQGKYIESIDTFETTNLPSSSPIYLP